MGQSKGKGRAKGEVVAALEECVGTGGHAFKGQMQGGVQHGL